MSETTTFLWVEAGLRSFKTLFPERGYVVALQLVASDSAHCAMKGEFIRQIVGQFELRLILSQNMKFKLTHNQNRSRKSPNFDL